MTQIDVTKEFAQMSKLLSYSGNADNRFMIAIKKGTYNATLANSIIKYYKKKGSIPIVAWNGVIIIRHPHHFRVRGFGGRPYLHQYNFHGAVIYPTIEEKFAMQICAYNSRNGWYQVVGNNIKNSIIPLNHMKNRIID